MRAVGVIPARLGSSRFPGKPLAPLLGLTMIEHVYRRTALSPSLADTCVATCDNEIREAVEAFGGRAVMTSDAHERASDRAAEAARHMDADVVVMVQGDEPMTTPDMIDAAVAPFHDDDALQCVNLAKRITCEAEFVDPNTIKVVMDKDWNALSFSREPIPTRGQLGFEHIRAYKQVCIIPFRRAVLLRYAALAPTPLEIAEAIDMMRFLENGIPVRMVETDRHTHAVDTPADLVLVESLMRNDPLVGTY